MCAKCVQIARPQCGEQEFSVIVACLLTTGLVKNISSLVDTGKTGAVVEFVSAEGFSVFLYNTDAFFLT